MCDINPEHKLTVRYENGKIVIYTFVTGDLQIRIGVAVVQELHQNA